MPKRYSPRDIGPIFGELGGANDRAAIAVGGAMVEYALERCINARIREPQTKAEEDVLFTENGIFGSFYEKVWVAFFLKIMGPETRRNIDMIRSIRNHAAHDMNPISFDATPEIAARCRDLAITDEMGAMPTVLRERFIVCCQFYTANFMLRAGSQHDAEIAEAFSSLAPYLDR